IDRGRFPTLMARLADAGFDPALEPVPVAPAAHYTVGGIVTDLEGRTGIPGLYAAGECAATGVHGANRLASNSLLECLLFGRRAARAGAVTSAPTSRRRTSRSTACTSSSAAERSPGGSAGADRARPGRRGRDRRRPRGGHRRRRCDVGRALRRRGPLHGRPRA